MSTIPFGDTVNNSGSEYEVRRPSFTASCRRYSPDLVKRTVGVIDVSSEIFTFDASPEMTDHLYESEDPADAE